ncbi:tyrosine-type recombinase/integrase [Nonomuraea sp. NPDC023979]|uniref:tyrosine-type recombinase/integrase n=1 Tax=Nonomuraea sp. NPDC023979 TaxID=3154796 RepID=UPI0033E8722B
MKIGKSAQVRRGQEVARQMLNDQKSGAEVLPRYLFLRTHDNRLGRHPYPAETYQSRLRDLTQRLNVTDSMGRPVHISQTHHFRHTRATDLINAGVPIHVVMRYFGRLTPAMTMHYAKTRSEAAEHEFLRYKKFTADGASCPRQSLTGGPRRHEPVTEAPAMRRNPTDEQPASNHRRDSTSPGALREPRNPSSAN